MKAISYSLFGYGRQPQQGSFEFQTYLRGMWTNMRVNRVIYPGWKMIVTVDSDTSRAPDINKILNWAYDRDLVDIVAQKNAPLCISMLWRLWPIFEMDNNKCRYSHVLCRDIDSISTYREVQMVQEWIDEDKTIHCITDSISHNIPMMGGMVGFRPAYFTDRMKCRSWDQLMELAGNMDFSRKGSDQDFLGRYVYPPNADSATEHFILGMKQTIPEGGGRHYRVPDIEIEGVDPVQKCTNDLAGHVGAAGCYEPVMVKWLNTMDPFRDDYAEIEKQFPQLFFWRQ